MKVFIRNGHSVILLLGLKKVVFGMPGEAVKIGAETYILSPGKIALLLTQLTNYINQKDDPF
ncbi:MAG: hypothetical protein ACYCVH_16140 [Ignavibacteriaceae bacterium]